MGDKAWHGPSLPTHPSVCLVLLFGQGLHSHRSKLSLSPNLVTTQLSEGRSQTEAWDWHPWATQAHLLAPAVAAHRAVMGPGFPSFVHNHCPWPNNISTHRRNHGSECCPHVPYFQDNSKQRELATVCWSWETFKLAEWPPERNPGKCHWLMHLKWAEIELPETFHRNKSVIGKERNNQNSLSKLTRLSLSFSWGKGKEKSGQIGEKVGLILFLSSLETLASSKSVERHHW